MKIGRAPCHLCGEEIDYNVIYHMRHSHDISLDPCPCGVEPDIYDQRGLNRFYSHLETCPKAQILLAQKLMES